MGIGEERTGIEYREGQPIVHLTDESVRNVSETHARELAEAGRPPVLECSQVGYMSSEGAGQIIALRFALEQSGALPVYVCGASAKVLRIIEMAGINKVEGIEIMGELEATLEEISGNGAQKPNMG